MADTIHQIGFKVCGCLILYYRV